MKILSGLFALALASIFWTSFLIVLAIVRISMAIHSLFRKSA